MSRTLIWDGENYKRNKGTYEARNALRLLVTLSLVGAAVFILLASFSSWPFSAALLAAAIIVWRVSSSNDWDLIVRRKLNDSYYESMRQALVTQYPHGISYILHNVLETLRFFRITALPWQDKFFSIQYGWPNQTLLQEAIDAANYLSNKWSDLDPVEKTMAMSTIRNMIKSEVIFLRGHMYVADARSPNVQYNGVHINLEECMFYRNLYIYSYTSDVYSQMCPSIESLPAPTRQTPKPSVLDHPSPPHGSKAAFSLDEFLSVNKSLRYLDREQQVKKYEEYLVSLATGLVHHRDDPDDVW